MNNIKATHPVFIFRIAKATLFAAFLFFVCTINAQEPDYSDGFTPEDKHSFNDKRAGKLSLTPRKTDKDRIKKLKEDEAFWYADKEFEEDEAQHLQTRAPYIPIGQRTWFQTLLWLIIIGGFAGVVIWFLYENKIGVFRKSSKTAAVQQGEDLPEDIFAINYHYEISKALQQQDYRLAVRLQFLQLLKTLAERNIINYKQDKTNLDYIMELQSAGYSNDFFRVVRNYEYSWYGEFEVSAETYSLIKKDFDNIERFIYRH